MKTNEGYWHRCGAALLRRGHNARRFLAKHILRRSVDNTDTANDLPGEQPDSSLSPLDRIKKHLVDNGLARRVRVRLDDATDEFVLEDDDGVVRVKHYEAAVAIIRRMWLE